MSWSQKSVRSRWRQRGLRCIKQADGTIAIKFKQHVLYQPSSWKQAGELLAAHDATQPCYGGNNPQEVE